MNTNRPLFLRSILCWTLFIAGCGSPDVAPLSHERPDPNGKLEDLRPVIGTRNVVDEPHGGTSKAGKHKLEIEQE